MAQRTNCIEGKWAKLMVEKKIEDNDDKFREKLDWYSHLSEPFPMPKRVFTSGEEVAYFEIAKQLDEMRRKLEEISGLIVAPKDKGYILINKVWRKLGTR